MAKRAPEGEPAYDPLDIGLARSVMYPVQHAPEDGAAKAGRAGEATHLGASHAAFRPTLKRETGAATSSLPTARGFSRTKRVLLTPEEEREIERLVDRVAEHVGASLKLSHVLRACMALLCHAETEILRTARNHRLVRPANGDAVALAEFEQGVARILSLALRDAPALR